MALSPGQVLNYQRVRRISPLDMKKREYRTKKKEKKVFRVATWNARSLLEAGKVHNVVQEMKRLQIDILGVSEHRWPDSGRCNWEDAKMYYSGPNKQGKNGVAIIVRNSFKGVVENVVAYSERVMLVQFTGLTQKLNIVQVYAPTADKSDEEIEDFYNQLQMVNRSLKKHHINIIMGDLNAKVGCIKVPGVTGSFGLGDRNERGERLIQFCRENNYVIKNTFYMMKPRRLYTWKSPQDGTYRTQVVRNQIDYLLINKRFQNSVTRTAAYPGADVGSDHNPIVANCRIKFKTIKKRSISNKKLDTDKLKDPTILANLRKECEDILKPEAVAEGSIEDAWCSLKSCAAEAAEKVLGRAKRPKCKQWMTDEILGLMEDRRLAKLNREFPRYRELRATIRRKVKEAKLQWVTEQCEEAEELLQLHDTFNFHKKIKSVTGTYRKQRLTALRNKDAELILEKDDVLREWKDYAKKLFQDNREDVVEEVRDLTGAPILESEVEYALKCMKNRKAPGADELPAEVIKCVNIKSLTILFNRIYNSGQIPKDWLISTFVPIPKKPNAKTCADFRLIALMSHALKIFLKVIHGRIYKKCEAISGDTQFGFRKGLGTREALFAMKILLQQCYDHQQDVHVCFIDYEKAFDTIRHEPLMKILKEADLDSKDIQIIRELYWQQVAEVKLGEDQKTEIFEISKGVRQGCILSPILFNMYLEKIFSLALEDEEIGIRVNGTRVSNLRYADDSAIITENMGDMQRIIDKIDQIGREFGVRINVGKTKLMTVKKNQTPENDLVINQTIVEKVTSFKYLGSTINTKLDCDEEIKIRCGMARATFQKLNKILLHRSFPLDLRIRVVKCYVWPVLLYGSETWSMKTKSMNRLEAVEMWTLRRMLRIPWTDRVTNAEVLERAEVDRELLNIVKKRKAEYLGHFLRGEKYELLRLILNGRIDGKRGRGRKKLSWLRNLRQWSGIYDVGTLLKMAKESRLDVV